jgi:hypothetical protein
MKKLGEVRVLTKRLQGHMLPSRLDYFPADGHQHEVWPFISIYQQLNNFFVTPNGA